MRFRFYYTFSDFDGNLLQGDFKGESKGAVLGEWNGAADGVLRGAGKGRAPTGAPRCSRLLSFTDQWLDMEGYSKMSSVVVFASGNGANLLHQKNICSLYLRFAGAAP